MLFPPLQKISKINYGLHTLKVPNRIHMKGINSEINICSKCLIVLSTSIKEHVENCKVPFTSIYSLKDINFAKLNVQSKISENKISEKDLIGNDSSNPTYLSGLALIQRLAFLGECFIENKTLDFDLKRYDFYIIYGFEIMGYFSRDRFDNHSLSCICVFPPFQRMGLGTLLIDFSQQKRKMNSQENIVVSENNSNKTLVTKNGPQRPFTKKAIFCYRKYWKYKVINAASINEIALKENMSVEDVILGLELNGFDFKEWKQNKEIVIENIKVLPNKLELI